MNNTHFKLVKFKGDFVWHRHEDTDEAFIVIDGKMIILIKNLSQDQADTYGLVLTSGGISYFVRKAEDGWHIIVNEHDYASALSVIEEYLAENQFPTTLENTSDGKNKKNYTGIYVAFLMLACHIITTWGENHNALINTWGSSASHITRGEWFRAVTALGLHANPLHLISNMTGIALFGTAVCILTGDGLGWLMILLSGFIGNLLNAILFSSGHLSIGASTAVFGALGILAGLRFMQKFRQPDERIKAWIPLAGGLALLGLLGSGMHTDVTAHFFGFLTGLVLGAIYVVLIKTPPPRNYQTYGYILTIGIITISLLSAI